MRTATALLAAWGLASGAAWSAAAGEPGRTLELVKLPRSQVARDFQAATPGGGTLRLSDFRGQVVLVNFWATWCGPCKEEMPAMERLHRRYGERGLVVLALSVDVQLSRVAPFVQQGGFTFPVGLDPKRSVASAYGVRVVPSTFIVDRDGRLTALAMGPREWDGPAALATFDALLR